MMEDCGNCSETSIQYIMGDTLKQVHKFRSSQVPKFPNSEVPKFRELQVPKFWKKVNKKLFFPISTKNISDTAFCLSTHYSIATLRAWMELNAVF